MEYEEKLSRGLAQGKYLGGRWVKLFTKLSLLSRYLVVFFLAISLIARGFHETTTEPEPTVWVQLDGMTSPIRSFHHLPPLNLSEVDLAFEAPTSETDATKIFMTKCESVDGYKHKTSARRNPRVDMFNKKCQPLVDSDFTRVYRVAFFRVGKKNPDQIDTFNEDIGLVVSYDIRDLDSLPEVCKAWGGHISVSIAIPLTFGKFEDKVPFCKHKYLKHVVSCLEAWIRARLHVCSAIVDVVVLESCQKHVQISHASLRNRALLNANNNFILSLSSDIYLEVISRLKLFDKALLHDSLTKYHAILFPKGSGCEESKHIDGNDVFHDAILIQRSLMLYYDESFHSKSQVGIFQGILWQIHDAHYPVTKLSLCTKLDSEASRIASNVHHNYVLEKSFITNYRPSVSFFHLCFKPDVAHRLASFDFIQARHKEAGFQKMATVSDRLTW